MPKSREFYIDDRQIEIFDDIFTAKEKFRFYKFVHERCSYTPERIPTGEIPESYQYQKTLKCNLEVPGVYEFGFFDNPFIRELVESRGLRVANTYFNLSTASDIYQYHVDDTSASRSSNLTGLYYVNIEWAPDWEGETHFSNDDMREVLFSSSFTPGRFVLFDGSIPHKSSQPSFAAKFFRYVYVVKFVSPKSPRWDTGNRIEDFYCNDPQELTEREQKAIEFIRKRATGIRHSGGDFFDHLYQTFCLLKKYGCSESVCLAGLYHSIYGTEFFQSNIKVNESVVESLIGSYANKLVKHFSVQNRDAAIMNNTFNLEVSQSRDLTFILYANQVEQARRLPTDPFRLAAIRNKLDFLQE